MNSVQSMSTLRIMLATLLMGCAVAFSMAPLVTHAQFAKPTNDADLAETEDDATVEGVIVSITKWLAGLLAALAILVIVIAGIIYITSAGNEDRIQLAKSMLIYAIIGLIVALLAFVIVTTVATALNAG